MGVGLLQCIVVMTAISTGTICSALKVVYNSNVIIHYTEQPQTDSILVTAVSAGACTASSVATSVYCDNMHNLLLLQEENEQTSDSSRSTKVIPAYKH